MRRVLLVLAMGTLAMCGVKGPPRPPQAPLADAGTAGPCCGADGGVR